MSDGTVTGPNSAQGRTATRIDSAHRASTTASDKLGGDLVTAEAADAIDSILGDDTQQGAKQLQRQSEQIAGHLRDQQHDLDQRLSEFNSQVAKAENEMRTERLVLLERGQELCERERESKRVLEEISRHGAKIESQSSNVTAETKRDAADLVKRLRMLEDGESQLRRQLGQLDEQRKELALDRGALNRQTLEKRQELEELRQDIFEKAKVREEHLERQQCSLTSREASLNELLDQTQQLHREALEMRLAMEQMWGELRNEHSEPELAQRLSRLRSKIADQFRLDREATTEQKQEVAKLVERLRKQQQKLRTRRSELLGWLQQREEDLEEQAARLIGRERELDAKEVELVQFEQGWNTERQAYHDEIKRLKSRLEHQVPHTVT